MVGLSQLLLAMPSLQLLSTHYQLLLVCFPDQLTWFVHRTSPLVLAWSPGYFSCILVCCMYGGSLVFQPLPFQVDIIAHVEGCGAST